ncbi:hypothetical protein FACS1894217_13510 [Clostridia bacterium]|nr:hypothetical protein FACS1894217_13510 [Clostridia bacterium]
MELIVDGINAVIKALGDVAGGAIDILPTSPLRWALELDNELLRFINWLVPVGEMITIGVLWLTCIAVWYAVAILLRWAKVAQG